MADPTPSVALQSVHNILVVDDDPSILPLCRKKLSQEGFHVLEA